MNTDFSKNFLKETLLKCIESISSGTFVDGLTLGMMVMKEQGNLEDIIELIQDWKQSAEDMEITQDRKKIFMYIAYLMTYTKGKVAATPKDSHERPLKKREEKALAK